MKKVFVVLMVLALATTAFAKSLTVSIDFSFDPDFEPELSMFKVYYQNEVNPSIIFHVMDIPDVSARSVNTPVFDLPPGRTSDFFVAAVYTSGEVEMSPPYAWKFTGRPTIIRVSR